jgi:hypothetical protein
MHRTPHRYRESEAHALAAIAAGVSPARSKITAAAGLDIPAPEPQIVGEPVALGRRRESHALIGV